MNTVAIYTYAANLGHQIKTTGSNAVAIVLLILQSDWTAVIVAAGSLTPDSLLRVHA